MSERRTPAPPDRRPAEWVEALWRAWIDPVEAAFDDLAARVELESLRERIGRQARRSEMDQAAKSEV
jgi:hypothetical protein